MENIPSSVYMVQSKWNVIMIKFAPFPITSELDCGISRKVQASRYVFLRQIDSHLIVLKYAVQSVTDIQEQNDICKLPLCSHIAYPLLWLSPTLLSLDSFHILFLLVLKCIDSTNDRCTPPPIKNIIDYTFLSHIWGVT